MITGILLAALGNLLCLSIGYRRGWKDAQDSEFQAFIRKYLP